MRGSEPPQAGSAKIFSSLFQIPPAASVSQLSELIVTNCVEPASRGFNEIRSKLKMKGTIMHFNYTRICTATSVHQVKLGLILSAAIVGICTANIRANELTVFSTDFESEIPSEFSGVTTLTGTQGYSNYGFGSNFLRNAAQSGHTVLTLTNLPPHTELALSFDLAIIDSWDGNTIIGGAIPQDFFNVTVDSGTVFSATFDNFQITDQTAPTNNLITYGTQLGFTGTLNGTIYDIHGNPINGPIAYVDSAYNMGHPVAGMTVIPHTANSVVIDFFANGSGWQGGSDESWAIDNLKVIVRNKPVTTIDKAVRICWPSFTNCLYQVQWQSSLATNVWNDFGAPVQGTGGTNCVFDTLDDQQSKFYRVVPVP